MKHIYKKYFKWILGSGVFLGGIATIYIVSAILSSTEFRLDDQIISQFGSNISTYRADIDFEYGGNKKSGIYFPRSLETLSTPETVTLDGANTGYCYAKVRGLYYSNQRGERLRPLDINTLTGLRSINSSYNDLQLSGGLFTTCSGSNYSSTNVYGQITMIYHGSTYYIIGGTNNNLTTNTHGTVLSGSLEWANNTLNGYIRDNYGGVGLANGITGCVDNRRPDPNNVCSGVPFIQSNICGGTRSSLGTKTCYTGNISIIDPQTTTGTKLITGSIQLSGFNSTGLSFYSTGILHIVSTGSSSNTLVVDLSGFSISSQSGTWNGVLLPPTNLINGDSNNAGFGDSGIPSQSEGSTTRIILQTIQAGADTDSLTANGGYFDLSFVVAGGTAGSILKLYRSENGSAWTPNTPDYTCTLNGSLICDFRTNHLSYFTTIKETTSNPNGGGGGGGGSPKDKCPNGDYSSNYYDKKCGEKPVYTGFNNSATGNIKKDFLSIIKSVIPIIQNINIPTKQEIISSMRIQVSPKTKNELAEAYKFCLDNNIINTEDIKKVEFTGILTRIQMAKMVSNYAINIMGKTGTISNANKCSFNDLKSVRSEMKIYASISCQLGLMGVDSKGGIKDKFNPYGQVTRAQFATILSRLLRGNKYDKSGSDYYIGHLNALNREGIINYTSGNPTERKELRGRAMIMLKRASDQ